MEHVVCIDNTDYPASLELHKIYRTLSDADAEACGDLRVVDESGEDYLFPAAYFVSISVPERVRSSLRRTAACGVRAVRPRVRTRRALLRG